VIEGASSVEVIVNDLYRFDAEVWGADPGNDIALLKICCGTFEALEWADQSEISVGNQAIAMGYPLGIPGKASVTVGIISAERYEFGQWVIQTDAAINPGNSGGPLISSSGKVLGINTRKEFYSSDGRPVDGLGFAVSLKTIQSILESLKSGYMKPAPTPTWTPAPPPTATLNASSYYNKGEEYRKAENWAMAIVEYTTAIQVNPNYARAYFGRAWSYDELGQDQNSVNDLTMVIQLDPNHKAAYMNRGISYSNLGQYQLAINDFTKDIQLDPDYAPAYSNRGIAYYGLGQYQTAINDYTMAIQLDPDFADAYANRGNAYDDLGQYQTAINDLTKAIQLDPDFAWAHRIRGFVYRNLGQYTLANADDTKACSLDSQYC
jgi:tetratricopeptide (TPR) repeat protein